MKSVVIFGGSGFVGAHIIRKIVKHDYRIIVPYQKTPNSEKIRFFESEEKIIHFKFEKIEDPRIIKFIKESEIVLNLKTIWDDKQKGFKKAIYEFTFDLIDIVKKTDPNKLFLFFSGLGVDKQSNSTRTRIIAETEEYIEFSCKNYAIIRPGIIIGGGDEFIKRLLPIFKYSLIIPLFGSGKAKVQPVFIEDVVLAIHKIMNKKFEDKNIYELAGNEVFSYKSLYLLISKSLNIKRFFIPIPFFFLKFLVFLLGKTPINLITNEQLLLFKTDNLSSKSRKNFKHLNIYPQKITKIIEIYIKKIADFQ